MRAAPPSPACGPDPVTRMPTTTVTSTSALVTCAVAAYQRGNGRALAVPGLAYDARDEHGCERDQHDGREVVQPHDVGVEVCQHGDAADDRLERHVQADHERQPEQIAPFTAHPHDEEEHRDRHDHEDEGQQAVAELDDAVDPHLRRRDEGLGGAARPRRAPESRSGEPDQPAGADDRHLNRQRRPGRGDDATVYARGQPCPECAENAAAGGVSEPGVRGGAPDESGVVGSAAIGPASWECAPDVAGGGPCHPGRGRNPVESKGRMRARRALHH